MPAPNTHHATVHAHFARAPSPALLINQEAANRPRAVGGKAQRAGRQGFASFAWGGREATNETMNRGAESAVGGLDGVVVLVEGMARGVRCEL
jgi:hypothetical protein